MTTLGEGAHPGDIVVVRERGRDAYVLIGAMLGPRKKRGREKDVELVLVHDVDPTTMLENLRVARAASPDLPLVAIVATGLYLRSMRLRWWQTLAPGRDDANLDPMTVRRDDPEIAF